VIDNHTSAPTALPKRALIGVVDDDASVRKALGRLLRSAGFDVVAHASAVELLVGLHQQPIQCLVLDIHLEGMGGLDLHDYLTDAGIRLPVVFITAHDDPATRQRAEQAHQIYLRKPVDSNDLLDAITSLIGGDPAPAGPSA